MTNIEIVISEALNNGIFTEEQIEGFLSEGGDIPLKTYRAWQDSGFTVRKGQKAKLETKLWKKKMPKKNIKKNEEEGKEKFILVPAYLFSLEQVVKIGNEYGN